MRNYAPAVRRRGRPVVPTTARADILMSARGLFARHGYRSTSVREVARTAHVDPALVRHYFSNKDKLFAAAVQLPFDPGAIATLTTGNRSDLGRRLARLFLSTWDAPEAREVVAAIMASVLSDEGMANLVRETADRVIVGPLAQLIGTGEDAALRAELVGSHLIGLAMARYGVRLEPLASTPIETLIDAIAPTLQQYLFPMAA